MKKLLCVALVAIIAMSFMLTASAAETSTITFPSLNEAFVALSDFMKLDAIMVIVDAYHEAMGGFYEHLDVLLRGVRVVVNGFLGGVFAG